MIQTLLFCLLLIRILLLWCNSFHAWPTYLPRSCTVVSLNHSDSRHVIFDEYPILCHWYRRRSESNSCRSYCRRSESRAITYDITS
jgi:hypothetical protein